MKHILKTKKLLKLIPMIIAPIAIAIPTVLTITSCAYVNNGIAISKVLTFSDLTVSDQNVIDNGKDINVSFSDLLYGNAADGNYIIFVGSNMYDSTNKYFAGSSTHRLKELWIENWETAPFYDNLSKAWEDDNNEEFHKICGSLPFYFLIDYIDPILYMEFRTADSKYTPYNNIKPYSVWDSQSLIDNNKSFWIDDKEPAIGDYIRQDESAKKFRQFTEEAHKLFPEETAFVADTTNDSYVMFFDNHELVKVSSLSGFTTLSEDMVTYYFDNTK